MTTKAIHKAHPVLTTLGCEDAIQRWESRISFQHRCSSKTHQAVLGLHRLQFGVQSHTTQCLETLARTHATWVPENACFLLPNLPIWYGSSFTPAHNYRGMNIHPQEGNVMGEEWQDLLVGFFLFFNPVMLCEYTFVFIPAKQTMICLYSAQISNS